MEIVETDGKPAQFRVTYETDGVLSAQEMGAVVSRMGFAISRFKPVTTNDPLQFDVTLANVANGSFIMDFMVVASAFADLDKVRDALGGFIPHYNDVVAIVAREKRGDVSKSDRKTVQTIAAPVANDHAQQVVIQNNFSNATLQIDKETASALFGLDEQARRAIEEGGVPAEAEPSPERPRPWDPETVYAHEAFPTARKLALADDDLVTATMHKMDGEWYARPEGLGGVMLPARMPSETEQKVLLLSNGGLVRGHVIREAGGIPRQFAYSSPAAPDG